MPQPTPNRMPPRFSAEHRDAWDQYAAAALRGICATLETLDDGQPSMSDELICERAANLASAMLDHRLVLFGAESTRAYNTETT